MKKIKWGVLVALFSAGGTMLLTGTANARLSMPEREHVQTVVIVIEFLSFIVAVAIAVFVWNFSKRDRKNRDSEHGDK